MLAPCRRVARLWPVLLSISALAIIVLWRSHGDEEVAPEETDRDDWVAVR
jgi:hypothetical protein